MRYLEDGYWVENMGRYTLAECDQCGHSEKRRTYYGARAAILQHRARTHETTRYRYTPPETAETPGETQEEFPF